MRRIKKLFYVPGLISLFGLLIVLPSFYKQQSLINEYCLTYFSPSNEKEKNSVHYSFSEFYLEKDISGRKKIKFALDDNIETNKTKLAIIRYEALKLKYTEDTSTVVLINLSDSITYGTFVSILDICINDDHKRYASWDNKFVIFGERPKVTIKDEMTFEAPICGWSPIIITKKSSSIKKRQAVLTEQSKNKIIAVTIGWTVLVLVSIFRIRKRIALRLSSVP